MEEVTHLLLSLPFCLLCKVHIHALELPLLSPCGHIFCRKCVRSYRFQRSVKCPVDHVKVKISLLKESPDILEVNSILKEMLQEYAKASPAEKPVLAASVTSLVDNMHKTFALKSVEVRQTWSKDHSQSVSLPSGQRTDLLQPDEAPNQALVQRMYEKYHRSSTAINAPRRAPSMSSNELHGLFAQRGETVSDRCESCKALVASVTCLCTTPFPRLCEKCSIKHAKHNHGLHSIEPLAVFNLIGPNNDLTMYNARKDSVAALRAVLQSNLDLVEKGKAQVEAEVQRLTALLDQWRAASLEQLKRVAETLDESFRPLLRELSSKQYERELSGQSLLDQLLVLSPDEIHAHKSELTLFSFTLAADVQLEKALTVALAEDKIAMISKPRLKQALEASQHAVMLGLSAGAKPVEGELPVSITPEVRATESRMGAFAYDIAESGTSKGPMVLSNNAVYIGEWNAGLRHGRGLQIMADGSKFEGAWQQDKAHGRGRLITATGDVYEGNWQNSMANDYGCLFLSDGTSYEGYWKDDLQDGQGQEVWPDGTTFSGSYTQGKKNGKGKYEYESGNVYDGNFEDDAICGFGVYKWVDGRVYEGQWKDSMMHGYGKFTWPDGKQYVGSYVCDKKHGHGELTHPDGRKYTGAWHSGLQHGKGTITVGGRTQVGEWREGRCL